MNLIELQAAVCSVSVESFTNLLNKGVKPTKALYRLGVEQQLAGIVGTLKLAVTSEEINSVYENEGIKSCMTNHDVGPFYSHIGLQVLYNDRYRCVVNLKNNWKAPRGYGFLHQILDTVIGKVLKNKYDPLLEFFVGTKTYKYDYYTIPELQRVCGKIEVLQGKFNIPSNIFRPYLDFNTILMDVCFDSVDYEYVVDSITVPNQLFEELPLNLCFSEKAYMIYEKDFSRLEHHKEVRFHNLYDSLYQAKNNEAFDVFDGELLYKCKETEQFYYFSDEDKRFFPSLEDLIFDLELPF